MSGKWERKWTNTRRYVECSIRSTARAVLAHAHPHPHQATVLVDGLSRAERRRFAAGLRHQHVSVSKVRGVQDQSDALIRLADALAGFVRAAMQGDSGMQALLRQAREAGGIREA